jgi:hypothetical protein
MIVYAYVFKSFPYVSCNSLKVSGLTLSALFIHLELILFIYLFIHFLVLGLELRASPRATLPALFFVLESHELFVLAGFEP